MPAFPFRRISQSWPRTWRTCGSLTFGRPTDSINSEIRTSRACMSAGNSADSASTVSFNVSTVPRHRGQLYQIWYERGRIRGHAIRRNPSTSRTQRSSWFQLVKMRLTKLSSAFSSGAKYLKSGAVTGGSIESISVKRDSFREETAAAVAACSRATPATTGLRRAAECVLRTPGWPQHRVSSTASA